MQFDESKTRGYCLVCGAIVPIRDIRSQKGTYCSRKCASQTRFQTRYRGSNSGPADRPVTSKPAAKMAWDK